MSSPDIPNLFTQGHPAVGHGGYPNNVAVKVPGGGDPNGGGPKKRGRKPGEKGAGGEGAGDKPPKANKKGAKSAAESGGTKRVYSCPHCQRSYDWNYNLNRHLKYECGKENAFQVNHILLSPKNVYFSM